MEMIFIVSYLVLGAAAGLLAGMLGIGGGIIIVPMLIFIFSAQQLPAEMVPQLAVASSLGSIIFTSIAAMRAQAKRGAVDWQLFKQWTLALMAGGFCSGYIASWLSAIAMQRAIAVFLLIVATIMFSQWKPKPERELPGPVGRTILGFGSGLASALAGIGGGNIIVPLLLFFNVAIVRAVATSSALGLPIALVGSAGYISAGMGEAQLPPGALGFVYLPATLGIAAMTLLTAPVGVAIAHRMPAHLLKRVFSLLLALVALRMLWTAFR
jgi:uncharacterized membrane protein YfcA